MACNNPLQPLSPHPRLSFHAHYDRHAHWLDSTDPNVGMIVMESAA